MEKKVMVGKKVEKISEKGAESVIPKILVPNSKLVTEIFGIIFILALLWSIFSGNNQQITFSDFSLEVGWPLTFLYLKEDYSNSLPTNILNLILDMVVYLVLSYILAVIFTVIQDSFESGEKANYNSLQSQRFKSLNFAPAPSQ